MASADRDHLHLQYQSLVGSLNWLAHTTRPDLSTVASLLAQHQNLPSPGHYDAALYVVKYLVSMKNLGIYFSSSKRSTMELFLHFPLSPQVLSMADANWGPQDATQTKSSQELPLFTYPCLPFTLTCSGPFIGYPNVSLSLLEALPRLKSMPPTNVLNSYWNFIKFSPFWMSIIYLCQLLRLYIMITRPVATGPSTTKGLRHIQMKENCISENVHNNFIQVCHIHGKINLADIFTKEMKDVSHFIEL